MTETPSGPCNNQTAARAHPTPPNLALPPHSRSPITDVNEAPGWLSGVAAGVCLVSGLAISAVLQVGGGVCVGGGEGGCVRGGGIVGTRPN